MGVFATIYEKIDRVITVKYCKRATPIHLSFQPNWQLTNVKQLWHYVRRCIFPYPCCIANVRIWDFHRHGPFFIIVILTLLHGYVISSHGFLWQYKKLGKIFTIPTYKLLRALTVVSDIKTLFSKCCLTQWISRLPRSFGIHWVRQYLVNVTDQACIVNATVYMTKSISTCKLS